MNDDFTDKMLKADQSWRTLHNIPKVDVRDLQPPSLNPYLQSPPPLTLRHRAANIAKAPWVYSSADITETINELLAALPEEAPVDYKDALQVVKYPQLNDPLVVDMAFAELDDLMGEDVKTAERDYRRSAAIMFVVAALAAVIGLWP